MSPGQRLIASGYRSVTFEVRDGVTTIKQHKNTGDAYTACRDKIKAVTGWSRVEWTKLGRGSRNDAIRAQGLQGWEGPTINGVTYGFVD